MGDRPQLVEVRAQTGLRPVWRRVGGTVEQHDPSGDKDPQVGHDGPEGLLGRGTDHEEAAPQQADPAVRGVHRRGADLHYYGADETRLIVGLFAR